jgi:hypothetical protein
VASVRRSPDWSDVAGAANYTIQIDNAENFWSPLIVNQNVGTPQLVVAAPGRSFERVR